MTKITLLLFGIGFCVAGIVVVTLIGNWSLVAIVLSIIGLILLIASFLLWFDKPQLWRHRSLEKTANGLAITSVVLAVIGLINIVAIRYNIRHDFTENQLYTLSAQSQAIVSKLEQPLQVLIFDRAVDSDLENLLQNYRRQNNRFQFRFVNPEREIGLARQYEVQSLGEIYLEYGGKRQKLEQGNTVIGEAVTETQITNAIETIKRDRVTTIYLLQGHGEVSPQSIERGLTQVVTNLEAKGNTVEELNLASTGKIPDNADLILIAGAMRKLLPAEVSSLQNYLISGGNLLLLLSPNTDIAITPLLENWGVELDNRLIVDSSNAGSVMGFGPAVLVVSSYGNHPITNSFGNGISLFPESRPLKIKSKAEIDATSLITTTEQTWAESDLKNEEITFDINRDLSGPLNIAIALEREQPLLSRMVIFGSSTFATNGWFEQQLNGDILLNSISWLLREDRDRFSIRPKETANRNLNLSSTQARIINWLALRIVPFLALVTGFLYWNRRR